MWGMLVWNIFIDAKYLLSVCYQPRTALGTGESSANKTEWESNPNTFLWRKAKTNKIISENDKEIEDYKQTGDVMM